MYATNKTETVKLTADAAIGVHAKGKTAVKKTTCGRFAVVAATPRRDGSLRLIKLADDAMVARRYNFAINGDKLGE